MSQTEGLCGQPNRNGHFYHYSLSAKILQLEHARAHKRLRTNHRVRQMGYLYAGMQEYSPFHSETPINLKGVSRLAHSGSQLLIIR